MSGHLTCTATLSKSRHISTLNYLRSADLCLTRMWTVIYWLSVPTITDSANKFHVFGGHFNPKSLAARTLTCDRQFAQMSMLPSGDRKQYFISRVNSCMMNHVIVVVLTNAQNANNTIEANNIVATKSHRGQAVFGRPA